MKIKDYLIIESNANTKSLTNKLDIELSNQIIKTIDNFINKNIDPINGWDYPLQRDEVLLNVAQGQIHFFNGMIKSTKQNLKKK